MLKNLKLALLGVPQIMRDKAPLHEQLARKEQALLFHMAVNGRVYQRTTIAALFWENGTHGRALGNLRDLLPNLRLMCGAHLSITHQTIAFNRHSAYWLDVEVFQSGLQGATTLDPSALCNTLDLYRGEFLTDFSIRNAPEFEHWLLAQREQLNALAVQGWQRLLNHYVAQGEYLLGLDAAKQLLKLAPWQESLPLR